MNETGDAMSKTVVNSWNDFDSLRHVIVGRADFTCIPPTEPATEAKIPEDSDMRGLWGPRPLHTVEAANRQLDTLTQALEAKGVRVDRPTPIQWNQAVTTPDFMTGTMFGCMPPRDVLLTVGKEILSAPMSFRCRYWEYLAYHDLMQRYFDEDPEFRWEQAPRPRLTDDAYQVGYFDEITLEERLRRTAALDFVTTEHEPLFDAADVLRIGSIPDSYRCDICAVATWSGNE
jgi:glycine amidinotransferase